jgi:teichuronic acid exporter
MSEDSLKKKTTKGIFWSSIDNFSTQGISFIFSLFLARLLSPHDYGIIGILSVFLSVMSPFIDSGFSNALIHKMDRTEVDNSTTFYFNVMIGIIAYLIMFLLSPYIAVFYNMPILSPLTKVLALNLIFSSFCIVQQALLSIKIDFKTQAKISLICTIIFRRSWIVFCLLWFWCMVFGRAEC